MDKNEWEKERIEAVKKETIEIYTPNDAPKVFNKYYRTRTMSPGWLECDHQAFIDGLRKIYPDRRSGNDRRTDTS